MKAFLPLLAATAAAPAALAQGADDTGWYAGIGYEYLQENNMNWDYQALNLTGGLNINPYLGFEGSVSTGLSGDENVFQGGVINDGQGGTFVAPATHDSGDLNYRVDIVGVGRFPVTDRIRLVGKLGISQYEYERTTSNSETVDVPASSYTEKLNGTGLVAGLGGEFSLTDRTTVSGTFNHYEEQGALKGDVEGFQIGLKRRF